MHGLELNLTFSTNCELIWSCFFTTGIKLIMDMVPNHSSDLHEWFNKSVNRIEPYTDYYVWQNATGYDSNGKPVPPNNWVSLSIYFLLLSAS